MSFLICKLFITYLQEIIKIDFIFMKEPLLLDRILRDVLHKMQVFPWLTLDYLSDIQIIDDKINFSHTIIRFTNSSEIKSNWNGSVQLIVFIWQKKKRSPNFFNKYVVF